MKRKVQLTQQPRPIIILMPEPMLSTVPDIIRETIKSFQAFACFTSQYENLSRYSNISLIICFPEHDSDWKENVCNFILEPCSSFRPKDSTIYIISSDKEVHEAYPGFYRPKYKAVHYFVEKDTHQFFYSIEAIKKACEEKVEPTAKIVLLSANKAAELDRFFIFCENITKNTSLIFCISNPATYVFNNSTAVFFAKYDEKDEIDTSAEIEEHLINIEDSLPTGKINCWEATLGDIAQHFDSVIP